jgi:hypothetical protein
VILALFIYTIAAFGCTYVLGHSVASRHVREVLWEAGAIAPMWRWLVMLIECPACLGFWIGLFVGGACAPLWPGENPLILAAVIGAFYTSGSNFLLGRLTGLMPLPAVEAADEPPAAAPPLHLD